MPALPAMSLTTRQHLRGREREGAPSHTVRSTWSVEVHIRIGHDWLNAAINELACQHRARSKAESQSNGSRSSKHQQLRLERPLIIGCIHD